MWGWISCYLLIHSLLPHSLPFNVNVKNQLVLTFMLRLQHYQESRTFVTVQCINMHRTYNFYIKGLLSQQGLMYFIIFFRWGTIFVLSVQHLVKKKSHIGLYSSIEKPLQVFQSAAILEVCTVHKFSNTCLKCCWILVWLWVYWINHHIKEFQTHVFLISQVLHCAIGEWYVHTCSDIIPVIISLCHWWSFCLLISSHNWIKKNVFSLVYMYLEYVDTWLYYFVLVSEPVSVNKEA